MATLTNTKIKDTYPALLKATDNGELSATEKVITDGVGNNSTLSLGTDSATVAGTLAFGSLKDSGENITITKFVDEADGIASNDNDTTIPTSAAVKNYVDSSVPTESDTLETVTARGNTANRDIVIHSLTIGRGAGDDIDNIAFGNDALYSNTTGYRNSAIGALSLLNNTTGVENTGIGHNSLVNSNGDNNTGIGVNSLRSTFTGSNNTGIGNDAGSVNVNGSNNVYIGYSAQCSSAYGISNEIVIGANATGNGSNTATYGDSNITSHVFTSGGITTNSDAVINGVNIGTGKGSLVDSTNTRVGSQALVNSTGVSNTAIGSTSLQNNSSGSYNTAVGYGSLDSNADGDRNTAVGFSALGDNTTGNNNTAIGRYALRHINGSDNIAIGEGCAEIVDGTGVEKTGGTQNVYIGKGVFSGAAYTINEMVFGYGASGNGSNTATYGNLNIASHIFAGGNVGIGTASVTSGVKLQVQSSGGTVLQIKDTTSGSGDYSNIWLGDESSDFAGFLGYNHSDDAMTFGTTATERMRIDSSGQVGIRCTPSVDFEVLGTSDVAKFGSSTSSMYNGYYSSAGTLGYIGSANGIVSGGATTDFGMRAENNMVFGTNGNAERMRITSTGLLFVYNLGAGGATTDINYNTSTGEIYYVTSSARYKENIEELQESALDKINNLKVKTFDYIDSEEFKGQVGLIAEEVNEQLPFLVNKRKIEGYDEPQPDSVKYSMLSVYLLKAIQEQQEIINDLKSRIETLEAK